MKTSNKYIEWNDFYLDMCLQVLFEDQKQFLKMFVLNPFTWIPYLSTWFIFILKGEEDSPWVFFFLQKKKKNTKLDMYQRIKKL